MNGLGGLNGTPNGVVIRLVQPQPPVIATRACHPGDARGLPAPTRRHGEKFQEAAE
jgi:hypothetical protein